MMAYDQSKLIKDVRMHLGCISEETLPESTIIYWGDFFDADPLYTSNYPYILWKTTLCCIDFLKAKATAGVSTTATKSSSKEKVGDVQYDSSSELASVSDIIKAYDELYNDYLENPEKFGLTLERGSVVLIGGVNQAQVDNIRSNPNTTSVYNPLPVTAFPRCETNPYRRRRNTYK